jgi:uncharacterized membrane protein YcaP (DUF421 family)
MSEFLTVDWHKLFVPGGSVLEILIRGTVLYLVLFVLLRVILKRETGMLGITDILVIVLIADAAQNGLAGSYQSITEGIFLVATIIFWSYILEWLGFRYPRVQRLIKPRPLMIIEDGRLCEKNLARELLTEEEVMNHLRERGVADLAEVKRAYVESDGQISVLRTDEKPVHSGKKKSF